MIFCFMFYNLPAENNITDVARDINIPEQVLFVSKFLFDLSVYTPTLLLFWTLVFYGLIAFNWLWIGKGIYDANNEHWRK